MKIAIIGAGNVGSALAKNWASKGHDILLGVRDPGDKAEWSAIDNVQLYTPEGAAEKSEVVIISLPVKAIVDVAKSLRNLKGKVVIDATNSVFQRPVPYTNGYEALKEITGGEVVKGFNTTGFENMANPHYGKQGIDMFTAGDSQPGKTVVKQLALDAGFATCYDFGGGDKVPLLEQFALAWIKLAIMQGQSRDIAFKILHRS